MGVVNLQNLQKFNWKLGSNIQSVSRGFESMARRIGPGIQDLARGVGPGIKDLSRNLGALGSNVGTNINDFSRVSLSNLEGYSKDIRNHVQDFFDMTMNMSPRISNAALDGCTIYVIESLRHSAKELTRAHADDVQAREDKHKVALATVRKGHEERLRLLSAERARHGEELRVFRDQQASHVKALNENHRQEVQGLQRKVASQLKAHRVLPAAHQTTRRNTNIHAPPVHSPKCWRANLLPGGIGSTATGALRPARAISEPGASAHGERRRPRGAACLATTSRCRGSRGGELRDTSHETCAAPSDADSRCLLLFGWRQAGRETVALQAELVVRRRRARFP